MNEGVDEWVKVPRQIRILDSKDDGKVAGRRIGLIVTWEDDVNLHHAGSSPRHSRKAEDGARERGGSSRPSGMHRGGQLPAVW